MFFIIVHFITKIFKFLYSKNRKLPNKFKNNVHYGIENISKLIIGVGFILTIANVFGIEAKELVTSLSIVAAAFAILFKEFIIDLVSGIYLSFSKEFEINDYVKLKNHKGNIVEIGMLKSKILNENDDLVLIPNSTIHNNEIINYTKRDIRLLNVSFQIDINFIKDIEKLEAELIDSLKHFNEYIEEDSYNLKIVELQKDYLDLKFQYRLKHFDKTLLKNIRKKTVRKVFNFIASRRS
ncbi:MAG: mechanosensitive ion channel domain-containing protein [Flavobacteriaceae bacterium]